MKIQVISTYIAQCEQGEKVIPIGSIARLIFHDGTYHKGEIEAITENRITISGSDGEYTYRAGEIRDIEICE
ncbi:hypothetical protein LJC56_09820 [Christensenellaceae bacterium OttesenSCG-928-K19]|nr:hypothetical protein [Christensenellaceae bacterium OttesenSCG-928-K19]